MAAAVSCWGEFGKGEGTGSEMKGKADVGRGQGPVCYGGGPARGGGRGELLEWVKGREETEGTGWGVKGEGRRLV